METKVVRLGRDDDLVTISPHHPLVGPTNYWEAIMHSMVLGMELRREFPSALLFAAYYSHVLFYFILFA